MAHHHAPGFDPEIIDLLDFEARHRENAPRGPQPLHRPAPTVQPGKGHPRDELNQARDLRTVPRSGGGSLSR